MKKRWMMLGSVFFVGVVVLSFLYINMPSWYHRDSIPVPKYRMDLNLNSAEGFDEVLSAIPPSGFPKLTLRQGEAGTVGVTLTRLYTEETLWVTLSFYGIAPRFDKWILGLMANKDLPEEVTYSINPSIVELSTDEVYSSNLTIAVGPYAHTGSFKLSVETYLTYTSDGQSGSSTGRSFTLEIKPSEF